MSTVVAQPSPAPMSVLDRHPSPRSYPTLAAAAASPSNDRMIAPNSTENHKSTTPNDRSPPDGKKSPKSSRSNGNVKVIVKKEPPSSPSIGSNSKPRPRRLDLTSSTAVAAPLSSRPSAGVLMHDVGLACLSPGFQTHDPTMREQLQRSISVRDQQRSIIESRMLQSAKGDGPGPDALKSPGAPSSFRGGPPTSKKRPPPAGLSIVPPPAERFANERVIQSAPLGHTFTGRHQHPQGTNEHHAPNGHEAHIRHVPAIQTSNRLPPIADVFGQESLQPNRPPFFHANSTGSHGPPLPSPGFPPQTAHPMSQPPSTFERPREYKSAEDAVQELTGGREDLRPKIIRYGGKQPPTPPSPHANHSDHLTPHRFQPPRNDSLAGRRRSRNEYESGSSPPLGSGPDRVPKFGPFGAGRDSPATTEAKKEEFMSLMSRAWDLFHS